MSDENAQLHRDLGRLESTVTSLADRLIAVDERTATMDGKLDGVTIYIETEKAKRRTWLVIGSGLASIIGGVVAYVVSWWEKSG